MVGPTAYNTLLSLLGLDGDQTPPVTLAVLERNIVSPGPQLQFAREPSEH